MQNRFEGLGCIVPSERQRCQVERGGDWDGDGDGDGGQEWGRGGQKQGREEGGDRRRERE